MHLILESQTINYNQENAQLFEDKILEHMI